MNAEGFSTVRTIPKLLRRKFVAGFTSNTNLSLKAELRILETLSTGWANSITSIEI